MPRQNFSKIETLPENDLKKIQSLAKNGYSFKYIFSWLQETGFKIAEKTVQNWHKKYLESIANDDDKAKKALSAIEKQERDTTPNPLIDDPKDLEKIKESWHIKSLEYLIENMGTEAFDTSLEISTVAIVYDLFIHSSILTKNRLNLYQQGLAKYPSEQIKSLKLLYEMYSEVVAIHQNIHFSTAIRCIDSFKREINKYKEHGVLEDDEND